MFWNGCYKWHFKSDEELAEEGQNKKWKEDRNDSSKDHNIEVLKVKMGRKGRGKQKYVIANSKERDQGAIASEAASDSTDDEKCVICIKSLKMPVLKSKRGRKRKLPPRESSIETIQIGVSSCRGENNICKMKKSKKKTFL